MKERERHQCAHLHICSSLRLPAASPPQSHDLNRRIRVIRAKITLNSCVLTQEVSTKVGLLGLLGCEDNAMSIIGWSGEATRDRYVRERERERATFGRQERHSKCICKHQALSRSQSGDELTRLAVLGY